MLCLTLITIAIHSNQQFSLGGNTKSATTELHVNKKSARLSNYTRFSNFCGKKVNIVKTL